MAKEAAFAGKMKGRLTSEEHGSREKEVTEDGDVVTVRGKEELGRNNEDKTWLRNTPGIEGERERITREGRVDLFISTSSTRIERVLRTSVPSFHRETLPLSSSLLSGSETGRNFDGFYFPCSGKMYLSSKSSRFPSSRVNMEIIFACRERLGIRELDGITVGSGTLVIFVVTASFLFSCKKKKTEKRRSVSFAYACVYACIRVYVHI